MAQLALVIEDEAALRVIYEKVLHDLGLDVLLAADGEEAMILLAQNTPQVIFLDMLMPKVDGSQVLQYVRSTPPLARIPTVIVTAHRRFETLIARSANDLFLLKPVRPRDIQRAVQCVLTTS